MEREFMNYSEAVSKRLPGARLDYRPVQSHGEYDFDLRLVDGSTAALEVTASVDQLQAATVAAVLSKKKGGSTLPAVKCQNSWIVFPAKGVSIDRIREKADDYLARLEGDGVERFFWLERGPQSVDDIRRDLNVVGASVIARGAACPTIKIGLPGGGGAVGSSIAVDAGEREAWKSDNRRKLGAAKTSERHLAVYIDPMTGLPWTALTEFDPPSIPPNLPVEITSLWLIGHSPNIDGNEFIAWHTGIGEGWQKIQVVCQ
jgi:hypothetical protein